MDGGLRGHVVSVPDGANTPEPGALAMFVAGLLGCTLFIHRRRRAARQS